MYWPRRVNCSLDPLADAIGLGLVSPFVGSEAVTGDPELRVRFDGCAVSVAVSGAMGVEASDRRPLPPNRNP